MTNPVRVVPKPQFTHRIKTAGTGCRAGLESQNFVMAILVTPAGGELVQLSPLRSVTNTLSFHESKVGKMRPTPFPLPCALSESKSAFVVNHILMSPPNRPRSALIFTRSR